MAPKKQKADGPPPTETTLDEALETERGMYDSIADRVAAGHPNVGGLVVSEVAEALDDDGDEAGLQHMLKNVMITGLFEALNDDDDATGLQRRLQIQAATGLQRCMLDPQDRTGMQKAFGAVMQKSLKQFAEDILLPKCARLRPHRRTVAPTARAVTPGTLGS